MPEHDDETVSGAFADALVAYDEALAAGVAPPSAPEGETPSSLQDALQCLEMLEGMWPRSKTLRADATKVVGCDELIAAVSCTDPTRLPEQFGRFRLERELGRGGYGVVFLAFDPTLHRKVALKIPRPDVLVTPELRRRFVRECHAAAVLNHPHIVPIYEAGEVGVACYLAAAYCEGPSLDQWLRERGGPIPARLAAAICARLADAVQHAHERNVLHRDLKPANVLLDAERRRETPVESGEPLPFLPKLTDFGLAKVVERDDNDTRTGAVLGTPRYMAPEQAEGRTRDIGPATDIYALGATLYEMLVGHPPHAGANDRETLYLVQTAEPPPPSRLRPDVPGDLEAICLKCLEKDPRERYANAQALAEDLRRFLENRPTLARPLRWHHRCWRWAKREPMGAAFVLSCILGPMSIFGTWVWYTLQIQAAALIAADLRDNAVREQWQLSQRLYAAEMRLAAIDLEQGQREAAAARLAWCAASPAVDRNRPDLASSVLRRSLRGGPKRVSTPTLSSTMIAFSSAGTAWAIDANRGLLRFDPRTGSVSTDARRNSGGGLFVSLDGSVVVVADRDGRWKSSFNSRGETLWSRPDPEPDPPTAAAAAGAESAWSPGSSEPPIVDASAGVLRAWRTPTRYDVLASSVGEIRGLALVDRGRNVLGIDARGEVNVWSAVSGSRIADPIRLGLAPRSFAVDRGGRVLAAVDAVGKLRVLDLASRAIIETDVTCRATPSCVAVAPDRLSIVVGDESGGLHFYHVATGRLLFSLKGEGEPVLEIGFSAAGGMAAAGRSQMRWFGEVASSSHSGD